MTVAVAQSVRVDNTNSGLDNINVNVTTSVTDELLIFWTVHNITGWTSSTLTCTSAPGASPTISQIGTTVDDTGGAQGYRLYWCLAPSAGAYTFNWATTDTGAHWLDLEAFRIQGHDTASPIAAFGNGTAAGQYQHNPATTTDAVTSGTAQTPSGYNALVLGFSCDSQCGLTPAAGTGFTSIDAGFGFFGFGAGGRSASKYITSGNAQALFTVSGTCDVTTLMVAIKEAGAAAADNRGKSPTRQLLDGSLPHLRMSPRSHHESQRLLRAQKRAYGFAATP